MADDIILLDGIKYMRYTPKSEGEFERMVVENAKEIFGENAIYLDIKKKIANALGAGTIPDGYLFYPEEKRFVLVEVELSSHDVYSHVAKQLNKFVSAFRNYRSRQKIATTLRDYIESDPLLRERMEGLTGDKGLYEFLLNDVFEALHETGNFEVFVIIEEKTEQIIEALRYLNFQLDILEVAIYAREGAESVKAMRFVPQYEITRKSKVNLSEEVESNSGEEIAKIKRGSVDYQSFYTELARRFPPNEQIKKINVPNNKRFYQSIFFGLSRVHYEWSFHNNPPTLFAVELHFEKSQKEANLKFIEIMEEHLSEIEKELDEKIIVQKDWGEKWAKLYIEKPITTIDESLKIWAIEKMVALINATYPILKNQKAKGKLSL